MLQTSAPRRSMAVIGAGAAGLAAAWALQDAHRVTLFEKQDRLGGHTHTTVVDDSVSVDTGFIVFNTRTYPQFVRWLETLDVASQDSCMSFSYSCLESGVAFSGLGLQGLLARRRNAVDPRFWHMLVDMARFNAQARRDLAAGPLPGWTLREYLARGRFGTPFVERYVTPLGAAIWSTAPGRMMDFPAETLLRFFDNHGLLDPTWPVRWKTVQGGSHRYVQAFQRRFQGTIRLGARIAHVRREASEAVVRHADGSEERFDGVVMACHADESLHLLADPTGTERDLLGAWRYETNEAVLHSDPRAMPPNQRAWASWNYVRHPHSDGSLYLTYHMNRLQRLPGPRLFCVTLNPQGPLQDVLARHRYTHPLFTMAALASQKRLHDLQGHRQTWFCGSYFGFGFHEDAVRSGFEVAAQVGVTT